MGEVENRKGNSNQRNDLSPEQALKTLFENWIQNQKQESEESLKNTKEDFIEENSFTKDGWIDYLEYCKANTKILFVLKEPNLWKKGYRDAAGVPTKREQISFYREFVEGTFNKEKGRIETDKMENADNSSKMKELLARMAWDILHTNENESDDVICKPNVKNLQEALKQVAFLNINKRGGGGKTDAKKLRNYYNTYKKEIQNEIDIVRPDIIVWCVREIDFDKQEYLKKTPQIISMWHPAYASKIKRKSIAWNGKSIGYDTYRRKYEECKNEMSGKNGLLPISFSVFKYMTEFRKRRREL